MSDILDRALPFGEEDPYVDMLCLKFGTSIGSGVNAIRRYDSARMKGLDSESAYEFAHKSDLPCTERTILIDSSVVTTPEQLAIDASITEFMSRHHTRRNNVSAIIAKTVLRGAQHAASPFSRARTN